MAQKRSKTVHSKLSFLVMIRCSCELKYLLGKFASQTTHLKQLWHFSCLETLIRRGGIWKIEKCHSRDFKFATCLFVCLFVCLFRGERDSHTMHGAQARQSWQDDKRPVRGRDFFGPSKCYHGA
jgi:hypothetical protein